MGLKSSRLHDLSYRHLLLLGVALLFVPAASQEQTGLVGAYASENRWKSNTGPADYAASGTTATEVDVFTKEGGIFIDFMITVDPPGQVAGGVCEADLLPNGDLEFSFRDGWGNEGCGTFRRTGAGFELETAITDANPFGKAVAGHYGRHLLRKTGDMPIPDRHPWCVTPR
jgi:hypothetical protein